MKQTPFITVALSFLVLTGVIVLLMFPYKFETSVLCAPDTCNLQSWLGSLSGCFAVIAAFVTIHHLRIQIAEQRKQTDFTVGDAMPTMDAVEHLKEKSELVVRLVNWNRRGIVVRTLATSNPGVHIFVHYVKVDEKFLVNHGTNIQPFVMKGWINRSAEPSFAEFRLSALQSGGDNGWLNSWEIVAFVKADIHLLGDAHRVIVLKADTRPILPIETQ